MLSQGKLLRNVLISNMDKQLEDLSENMYQKEVSGLEAQELFSVVIFLIESLMETFVPMEEEKKFYYLSTEFKRGSFLESDLKNLGIYEILENILAKKGQNLSALKALEAKCSEGQDLFEQSSLRFFRKSKESGLPSEAMGIRRVSSFAEEKRKNTELSSELSWLEKQDVQYECSLGEVRAWAELFDMDVIDKKKEIYRFHFFDIKTEKEIPEEEKEVYYEYFFVSCSVKLILNQMRDKHYDLRKLDEHARIEGEGNYVAFVIPELIRILVNEKAIRLTEAMEVVRRTCGFEDFIQMKNALKNCPVEYVNELVPELLEKIAEPELKGDE